MGLGICVATDTPCDTRGGGGGSVDGWAGELSCKLAGGSPGLESQLCHWSVSVSDMGISFSRPQFPRLPKEAINRTRLSASQS